MVLYMTMMTLVTIDQPGYFDYDEPYDDEEWYGCDGTVEGKMCHSPCRSETGGTFFSRIWTGDQSSDVMFAPNPMVTEVGDQPLLSDFETESHLGPSSVWDAAISLPLRCTHRNRMKLGCRSSTLVWDRQPGKDRIMSDRVWSFIWCPVSNGPV